MQTAMLPAHGQPETTRQLMKASRALTRLALLLLSSHLGLRRLLREFLDLEHTQLL